mgnify:CR=1 FL=1
MRGRTDAKKAAATVGIDKITRSPFPSFSDGVADEISQDEWIVLEEVSCLELKLHRPDLLHSNRIGPCQHSVLSGAQQQRGPIFKAVRPRSFTNLSQSLVKLRHGDRATLHVDHAVPCSRAEKADGSHFTTFGLVKVRRDL